MNTPFIPLALAVAGLFAAIAAYRGVRRGGARFYTLEREAILRRASLTLGLSTLLFLAAVGLLFLQLQNSVQQEAADSGEIIEGVATATPEPELNTFPPTPSPTATLDVSIPTATPTPIICRAVVENTSGNGLTLRESPGGAELGILAEGSLVQLVPEETPQEANGHTWRAVRSVVTGEEGWVAADFLALSPGCE